MSARSCALCSINLSGQSLGDDKFLPFVIDQFHRSGLDASKICFEITETAAVASFSQANRFIQALKELGCKFALDDFGTGLSSFGYLKHFPVDYLKIDGSFVREILHDPIDREMVRSINEIGHLTGKQTIAEFAENAEIIQMLTQPRRRLCAGLRHRAAAARAEVSSRRTPPAASAAAELQPHRQIYRAHVLGDGADRDVVHAGLGDRAHGSSRFTPPEASSCTGRARARLSATASAHILEAKLIEHDDVGARRRGPPAALRSLHFHLDRARPCEPARAAAMAAAIEPAAAMWFSLIRIWS